MSFGLQFSNTNHRKIEFTIESTSESTSQSTERCDLDFFYECPEAIIENLRLGLVARSLVSANRCKILVKRYQYL